MNFEESNKFVEKMDQNAQKKKSILMIIAFCAIAIVFLFIVILYLKLEESKTLKMYIDNKENNIASDLIVEENDIRYFDIKELCNLLGYTYHQGEYGSYNEDTENCYVSNDYTAVSISSDCEYMTKYLLQKNIEKNSNENDSETKEDEEEFVIEVKSENETSGRIGLKYNVLTHNEKLYISTEDIEKVFNTKVICPNKYRIYFQTMNYLVTSYLGSLNKTNYKIVSNYYENLTAIIDDMLVVSDGEKWGVYSFALQKEVISLKYDDILYKQSSNEFFVTADEYVGVVSSNGETIIKPTSYDNITKLENITKIDKETLEQYTEKLYIVEKNGKYGVVNNKNEVIIYPEYDSIGIDNLQYFNDEKNMNNKIFFDDLIPIKLNDKYGIIDSDGNETLKCVFDSFGYVETKEEIIVEDKKEVVVENAIQSIDNILVIPAETGIKGIIVKKDGLYGIYDATKKSLTIPCVFTKIYCKTKMSTKNYYLEYNGTELELEQYLEENDLKSVQ